MLSRLVSAIVASPSEVSGHIQRDIELESCIWKGLDGGGTWSGKGGLDGGGHVDIAARLYEFSLVVRASSVVRVILLYAFSHVSVLADSD